MFKVFRLKIQQTTKIHADDRIVFSDPYEIRKWAGTFGLTNKELVANFSWYFLRVLRLRVQSSVDTQSIGSRSMSSLYKPLSKNYKKKNKMSEGMFWRDWGTLIDSMTVWEEGGVIYLGIPLDKKLSDGRTPVHMLYRWLEFGTKTIPARPLIHPHLRFIMANIKDYFSHFTNLVLSGKIRLKKG